MTLKPKIMKPKITLTIILLLSLTFTFAQSIFENDIKGANPNTFNPYIINEVLDVNITSNGISRGVGIEGKNMNNEYKAKGWDSNAFDENDYFEFTLTPNKGFEIDFQNLEYTPKIGKGSVDNFELRSSIDGFTSTIENPVYDEMGVNIDLSYSAFQSINGIITFRLYAWGADNGNKGFSIKDFVFNGTVSENSLSLDDQIITSKSLKIIERQNGEVQFKLTGSLEMKSIQIIDLHGRTLYKFDVSGNSIALGLNILSQTMYVAMIQLTNGQVITKKAIKRG